MRNMNKKHFLSCVALALVCMMIGSGLTLAVRPQATAENTTVNVVLDSPFTAAIQAVHSSVVGINNYQKVRTTNNYYNGFGFGFGFGFGNNFGYGNRGQEEEQEPQTKLAATGSGVVVADHYVLTNHHVIENAVLLSVTVLDEESGEVNEFDATLVDYDENVDIAMLYVPDLTLTPVTLGNSDALRVGDWAICIGNPLSDTFTGTVTAGIVSGLNRNVSTTTTYDKYGRKQDVVNTMIQIDAAINSGNSGGGMFNTAGELVGIPTLKYSRSGSASNASIEGIGMCIPVNAAKDMIEAVVSAQKTDSVNEEEAAAETAAAAQNGLIGKPRLGISITSINANSEAVRTGVIPNGVYVSAVEAGGPADAAGMQAGDIIVDVEDQVITSVTQLQSVISEHKEGDVLAVKVYRVPGLAEYDGTGAIPDGEYVDLNVILAIVDEVKQ